MVELKQIRCTSCGAPIKWDEGYGEEIICPYCGSQFIAGPSSEDDVILMTDQVALARYETSGMLEKLENDIRFEIMRDEPWLPEDLEYKNEIRRLLRESAIVDKGSYWFTSPFPTVYRALQNGYLTIAGREFKFSAEEDIVFQCRMARDMVSKSEGPLLITELVPTNKAQLCGQMGGAMKGGGGG